MTPIVNPNVSGMLGNNANIVRPAGGDVTYAGLAIPGAPSSAVRVTGTQKNLVLQPKVIALPATAISEEYELGAIVDIIDISATAIAVGKFNVQIPHGYRECDLLAITRLKSSDRFIPTLPAGTYAFEGTASTVGAQIVVWHYAEL